tara:strand:- start:83 stop:895 length:813 start_codon:yes stop_codon:yes gene_type:complete
MTYVPKNRIRTNLYTSGDKFEVKADGTNYVGFYHSLWNGKFFTGKNQNDKPNNELVKSNNKMNQVWDYEFQDVAYMQYSENYDGPMYNDVVSNFEDVTNYNVLTKTDVSVTRLFPQQFYPTPTEEDYKLGSFTRYFAVKVNELQYIEVDAKTYKQLKSESNNIVWELYTCFKLQWTISGVESNVFDTNRDQVLIEGKKIKRVGFPEFLRNDYLKFYRSENINNQYTNGDDYTLPNGLNYQGLYHIMPNGQAMTGRFHGEAEDIPLTRVTS